MYFDSLGELIAMDGHGLYVWLAYGVFLMVIIWNLVVPRIERAQVLKSVRRQMRRADLQDQGDSAAGDD